MDEIWSVLDEIVYWQYSDLLLYYFMLSKVTGKILSDGNTYIVPLFYRLHGNIAYIVIVTSLILLLSSYHPSNRNNMDNDYYKIIM